MSTPRPHTVDECQELLLSHLSDLVRYWLTESRHQPAAEKLDGLVFSILAMIDGESGNMPSFRLVPSPHPEDADYLKARGENWWPTDLDDLSDGELHSRWSQREKPDPRREFTTSPNECSVVVDCPKCRTLYHVAASALPVAGEVRVYPCPRCGAPWSAERAGDGYRLTAPTIGTETGEEA